MEADQKEMKVGVIEAKMLVIIDDAGARRAVLSCSPGAAGENGHVYLRLLDMHGRTKVAIELDENHGHACVEFFGRANRPCLSIAVDKEAGNGVSIADPDGYLRLRLAVPDAQTEDELGGRPGLAVTEPGASTVVNSDGVVTERP